MHISKTSFCSFLRNLKVKFLQMKSIIILVTLSTPSVFIIPWLIDKAATAAAVVFFFLWAARKQRKWSCRKTAKTWGETFPKRFSTFPLHFPTEINNNSNKQWHVWNWQQFGPNRNKKHKSGCSEQTSLRMTIVGGGTVHWREDNFVFGKIWKFRFVLTYGIYWSFGMFHPTFDE